MFKMIGIPLGISLRRVELHRACLLFGVIFTSADDPKSVTAPGLSLGRQIVGYAREHLGRKVGDGECTTLAVEALAAAGAQPTVSLGRDTDYVWGDLVEQRAEIIPGDVLQFRDAVFAGRRRVVTNDAVVIDYYKRKFPHHTAIVEQVRDKGRELVVLHQNTGPPNASEEELRQVQRDVLRMTELREGSVKAYRPLPRIKREEQSNTPAHN